MNLHEIALPVIAVLAVLAIAWGRQPDAPRDPDQIERGSTTIMPEDR